VVSSTPRPHFTPGKDPVPILQEAGWAPGPVWTGAENLVPTGIRSLTVQPGSSVVIPTELPGPQSLVLNQAKKKIVSIFQTFTFADGRPENIKFWTDVSKGNSDAICF